MTLNENDTVSSTATGVAEGENEIPVDAETYIDTECDAASVNVGDIADRGEYEHLIKTKYKNFFAEDAERIIQKRFKKYKALEEKVRALEENAKSFSDIETLLAAERERAIRETEERMKSVFKANRQRADEIAILPRSKAPRTDVTKLTRGERAELASRALKGEKISF